MRISEGDKRKTSYFGQTLGTYRNARKAAVVSNGTSEGPQNVKICFNYPPYELFEISLAKSLGNPLVG